MTSRVEELQRMCDNINENGGLDSGQWHTALLAQIAQNLAVIADVMMEDRKTEKSSEKPNNCEPKICDTCRYYNGNIPCGSTPSACKEANKLAEEFVDGLKKLKPKDEPQYETQTETQNSNLTFEKVMEEIQTQVIEFPDTHQKFVFTRKIEMDGDSIKICGWEYKGVKDGEREGE